MAALDRQIAELEAGRWQPPEVEAVPQAAFSVARQQGPHSNRVACGDRRH